MSTILLVRHGQASWGKRDYDKLSPLGKRQSTALGEALAARGYHPDVIVTGGMNRHAQTAEGVARAAGWETQAIVDEGWAEYDHMAIIAAHKPAYRSMTIMQADLMRTLQPRKAFQTMFEAALDRWTSGEFDEEYPETFTDFQSRVEAALERLVARLEAGQTAAVFTSGGSMSWATTFLLRADAPTWSVLNHVTVNTGITKIVHGAHGTSVVTINGHAHVDHERDLLSVR